METSPQVNLDRAGERLQVTVSGSWAINTPWPPQCADALQQLRGPGIRQLHLAAASLDAWDSSLLVFLVQLHKAARAAQIEISQDLPTGLARLLHLAFAIPAQAGAARSDHRQGLFARVGEAVMGLPPRCADFLEFLGDVTLSIWRLILGHAGMRMQDFIEAMYECGVRALPIISITSLLFGLILAFVGAVQLTQFGAQIYVAGLVGIGMLRVMGAVMVGVVMSGRVGAAYAAMIGTMQVNEEVDALTTLGISPIDFLVLPRMLALMLMVPLLTVYADLMGILGGYVVGVSMLGLRSAEYLNATMQMVSFVHGLIGIAYGTVFGIIIALAGCYQGIRCGRSAQAVGLATTTAVVQSIVGIIIATAVITIICNVLGI